MTYCHKCGKLAKIEDSFCESCGAKISEFIKTVKEETKEIVREVERTRKRSPALLIIFLLIVGYVVLDVWAAYQLQPVISFDSILTSVSNIEDLGTSFTSGHASSTIRIKNPTFVPVLLGGVIYEAGYGSTKIAEGKTGAVYLGPYSEKDVPGDLKILYVGAGVSVLKGIKNLFTGQTERKYIDCYGNFGVTKLKMRSLLE
ncbi:MAG: hypothetical protein KJ600_04885 [Nanoarchaeota archaeon]|nr:hypothetical protein [Nanoarchaeota archaeon]MBU1103865.1 hypothetical protein [Nanoarchaeota archaeon]